ncbi:YmaF family protein, partial [Clostridioides difficile]
KLAEEGEDRHNHRAAGGTGEAIPINGGIKHCHKIN